MGYHSAIFVFFFISLFSLSNIYAQGVEQTTEEENSSDTTVTADSVQAQRKSDVETTIKYDAVDSIILSLDNNIVRLYGHAHIKYGEIELEAARIIIDYSAQTLSATGIKDSLGRDVDLPIFKNGAEVYETKSIVYNFKTGKARISEVVTRQGEGFLHGEAVFKNSKDELFSFDNTYTTCDLPSPHYRIRSKKTKAIPDDKIVSGLFNLEINDVPTPIGFPFGMFPAKREGSSGIIIPSYGEEQRRGFYLRGGGYFFDISDYVKMSIEGDIYTKGGHGLYFNTDYNKRYAYRGRFNFSYTQLRNADAIESTTSTNDYRLSWNHTPQSRGNSRFSAQVNAATAQFNQNNFLGVSTNPETGGIDNLTRKLTSSISYSKTFGNSPFSLGLSGRHSQDVISKQVDISLPELSLTMNNLYPLQKVSDLDVLEKINIRYSMNGTNRIDNIIEREGQPDSIAPFNIENLPTFFRNARNGMRHSIPLSTSFNLLKYFAVSPSVNYQERWYFEKLLWQYDEEARRPVAADTIRGFNRVYDYSVSAGVNTRLYGTYFFKSGKVKAIRHVMNPSLSFSYRPDFSDPKYGFYQRVLGDNGRQYVQSVHQGFAYGGAPLGESGSIGFSLNNTLEMKKQKGDTATNVQKVNILNNFGLSTSYNLLADSFNLSNISMRANTSLFNNKISLSLSGVIDPYEYRVTSVSYNRNDEPIYNQSRVNRLAFRNGGGIGTLSQVNLALSTSLNPKASAKEQEVKEKAYNAANLTDEQRQYIIERAEDYVDFSIPWNLRINYSLSFRKTGIAPREVSGHTVTFSGDFSLTEKWKATFNSGFNVQQKIMSLTTIGIMRDLHCWTMDFNWTPFGRYTNYNFTIRVKSALLQDLKINRRRTFHDNVN